jgi:hypothetical protein
MVWGRNHKGTVLLDVQNAQYGVGAFEDYDCGQTAMPSICPVSAQPPRATLCSRLYDRLIAKRKAPNVALIACMRKLIVILDTMIARGEKWDSGRYALR